MPKNWKTFFNADSDDWYKKQHPIAYYIIVAVLLFVLLAPCAFYLHLSPSTDWRGNGLIGFVGLIGSFVFGIGLCNFIAAVLKQYMGHLFSILTLGIGFVISASAMMLNLYF